MADTDLFSINRLPCNGSQTTFEISFAGGYISRSHITAQIEGIDGSTVDVPFTWINDYTIEVVPAPLAGTNLVVSRVTPKDKPLADFSDGAVLTENSLDLNAKQAVFIAAEAQDRGTALGERGLLVPVTETGFTLPSSLARAGGIFRWSLNGSPIAMAVSDLATDMAPFLTSIKKGDTGNPGGNTESVGTFTEAKAMNLSPTNGVKQVRLTDRAKATFDNTTENLDPEGENLEWFTDAAGKKWRLPTRINLDPKNLGAGLGADDTAAMARALKLAREMPQTNFSQSSYDVSTNGAVMLSPGTYYAGDIQQFVWTNAAAVNPTGTSKLIIAAQVPGTVTIKIPDGKYFGEFGGKYLGVYVDGIRFVGGKGAFKFTWPANQVAGAVTFSNCEFIDYTEAAITNAADDAPYLRVINCFFYGTPSSIGVAWGGYCDLMHLEKNMFLVNKYHVKIGNRLSGSITIRGNDFIKGYEYPRTADIWIVPAVDYYSNGWGSSIDHNKFGNESQGLHERRILIADEDTASGTHRGNRYHSATKSDGYVNGFIVRDNLCATKYLLNAEGNGPHPALQLEDGVDAPVIETFAYRLAGWQISGNAVTGGRYQWLAYFQFMPPAAEAKDIQNWEVSIPGGGFQYGVINTFVGMVEDRTGSMQADRYTSRPFDVDDDGGIVFYNGSTLANMGKTTNAIVTPQPDLYSGSNVGLITLPTANDSIFGDLLPFNYSGAIHWVRLTLNPSSGDRLLREVFFEVVNKDTGVIACQRVLQTNGYSDVLFNYVPPNDATANWRWRIRPVFPVVGNFNQFMAGKVFINVGKSPTRVTNLQTPGASFDQPHLIMGPYHMWIDNALNLRLKGDGAPTAHNQGIVVNGKLNFVTNPDGTAYVPLSSTAYGEYGMVSRDDTYLYVCISNNVWRRIAFGAAW